VTTEERFARIEHVTAGLAEERRKDREGFRALWRDTQRQLNELTIRIAEVNDGLSARIADLAEETRADDQRSRGRDQRLGDRIQSLVVAMGEYIASQNRK
jgi:hypothetical protein